MNFQENCYEMAIIYDATLFTIKQKQDETLTEYQQRFKNVKKIAKSHMGGPIHLHSTVKKLPDYAESNTEDQCPGTFQTYLIFLLFHR